MWTFVTVCSKIEVTSTITGLSKWLTFTMVRGMLFFFQAEDGIRDVAVTGVQPCALPILRELPRAELTVQIAQVRGGGDGRLLGIEPLVHPPVDAQTVAARRGRHELPEPFRADAGDGARVEAAFDHRREGEIHRQALTPEDLPDHREVASGSA